MHALDSDQMKAVGEGRKGALLIRAGRGQALKCLTAALCFLLLLFYSQTDGLGAYHALFGKTVRFLHREGLSDSKSTASSNTSEQFLSHTPRTLAWVTRNSSSSEPSRSRTLQNLTAPPSNVSVSKPLISQASKNLSSAASSASFSKSSLNSIPSNVSSITETVYISAPRMPGNASLSGRTIDFSKPLLSGALGNLFLAASNSAPSSIPGNMSSAGEIVKASAPLTTSITANTSSANTAQAQSNSTQAGQGLQPCTKDSFGQLQNFTGRWVDSPEQDFNGFYTMLTDCPKWVFEYDCKNPSLTGGPAIDPAIIHKEYRQIFQADQCQLRGFDARDLSQKMAGRKLIMIGDSLMRLHFYSLACLMRSEITQGFATDWQKSSLRWQGNYTTDWAEQGRVPVTKQFVGDFRTATGFEVHLRDVGTFNDTLLEQLLSDFVPMQASDVLLINWGAWYPRWIWGEDQVAWRAWRQHMDRLFVNMLATLPLQVIWKEHAPPHFGGATGSEIGIEALLPGGPWQYGCVPADVGEFWYDDYIRELLQGPKCKNACARIKVLPIFEMSRQRPNAHHGSLGRGAAMGKADCRHWCNAVTDWWTILLYNMLA